MHYFSLIAAMAANRTIGKDNQLPRHFPADLAYFKKITKGNSIVMGRKTYESIGRPLPHRRNIVLSSRAIDHDQVETYSSIPALLEALRTSTEPDTEIFVIGGSSIYQQFLDQNLVKNIYLTQIHDEYEGDTFFPVFEDQFSETRREAHDKFDFVLYEKI